MSVRCLLTRCVQGVVSAANFEAHENLELGGRVVVRKTAVVTRCERCGELRSYTFSGHHADSLKAVASHIKVTP